MNSSNDRIAFALANRNRGLRRSGADVLIFIEERIELWKGGIIAKKIPFAEVERIRYTHFRKWGGGMMAMLGGNLFGQREATFVIRANEENLEMALEIDAEYRTRELIQVFKKLYINKINLYETNSAGVDLFLLRPLGSQNREEEIKKLTIGLESEPDERNS